MDHPSPPDVDGPLHVCEELNPGERLNSSYLVRIFSSLGCPFSFNVAFLQPVYNMGTLVDGFRCLNSINRWWIELSQ